MDSAPWPQEIVLKPMEEFNTNTTNSDTNNNKTNTTTKPQPSTSLERKVRPQKEQALNCPRCNSTNTKFCYYNNYSLTQPRYFCKTCRRYWTEGGSLRNIPVGGGSRKNKRPASSSFPSDSNPPSKIIKLLPDLVTCTASNSKIHEEQAQDLNLGFPNSSFSEFMQMPNNTQHQQLSALELLTSSSRGLNLMTPFMGMQIPHDPNSAFPSGFSLQSDLKNGFNFSLDELGNGGVQESNEAGIINGGKILFPFEHLKSTTDDEHHQDHSNDHQQIPRDQQGDSTGYWTGILGGAGSWCV
ncbi:hypothetical protein V2J09_022518 [Rumex salicifolius]